MTRAELPKDELPKDELPKNELVAGVTELAGPLYSVARTFRWTALAGTAFATSVICQAAFNIRATPEGDDSALEWWGMMVIALLFFVAFFRLLIVARDLAVGHRTGHRRAIWACHLMYLGFPLLTLVGWICKRKLLEHARQPR